MDVISMLNFEGFNGDVDQELGEIVDPEPAFLDNVPSSSSFDVNASVGAASKGSFMPNNILPDPLFSSEELNSVLGMDQLLSQHIDEEEMFVSGLQCAPKSMGGNGSHPNASWMENFAWSQQQVACQGRNEDDIAKPATVGSSSTTLAASSALHDSFATKDDKTMLPTKYNKDNNSTPTTSSSSRSDTWVERFDELKKFKAENGHCCVPNSYEPNIVLGRWVKRQRYQYKLLQDNKRSSLTMERKAMLESLGFIWDSHDAIWEERLRELHAFRDLHGHCKVPSSYPSNQELAIWAKRQRRLFKIYCTKVANTNESSSPLRTSNAMTLQRILKLAKAGFIFNNLDSHGAFETLAKIAGAKGGNINNEPSTSASRTTMMTMTDVPSTSTTGNDNSILNPSQVVGL